MASRLEDISQQLASLTTILVGTEADSEDDNSSHCSVLRKLAAESDDVSSCEDHHDSYLEGLGHPGQLAVSEDFREKSVMRELAADDGGEEDPSIAHLNTEGKPDRDTYYRPHQALTCNQQFLQFMHKTRC